MTVSRTDPLANAIAAERFRVAAAAVAARQAGRPRAVGHERPEVNAYYNPMMNQVTFPAAILQPPFFDPGADPAVNYGETGATIGHEMGHGFDDEGRQFDAHGQAARLVDQGIGRPLQRACAEAGRSVRRLRADPGRPHQGRADARRESRRSRRAGGGLCRLSPLRRAPRRAGGDRRLYRRPALLHRLRAELAGQGARRRVARATASNPHSPEEYRVNGIVRNMDAWYAAFGVKPGDKLYLAPEDRVHVW